MTLINTIMNFYTPFENEDVNILQQKVLNLISPESNLSVLTKPGFKCSGLFSEDFIESKYLLNWFNKFFDFLIRI